MKKYIAIGHFKNSDNLTSTVVESNSAKDARHVCIKNGFVAYACFSETKWQAYKRMDNEGKWNAAKKFTPYHGHWSDVVNYLKQCDDIVDYKLRDYK